ncbi:MAG: flavin reductase [Clostridiales bacterium]|nr:flavin reductase [Clostridiales bacterium]
MKDYQISELMMNPFTKIGKEWGLVTAGTKEKANTMTVSWGGVGVLWGKNVVYIFIRQSRYTKEFIDAGEFFSLSFLNESYRPALNFAGTKTGRGIDKFAQAGLTPAFADCGKEQAAEDAGSMIPYPAEADLVLLCRKMAAVPISEDTFVDPTIQAKWYGDNDMHTMYVGEIVRVIGK